MRATLRAIFVLLGTAAPSFAHEVRPAYLEIDVSGADIRILWKQPTLGEVALPLNPVLSSGWLQQNSQASATESYLIRRWTVPASKGALLGQTVTIQGLNQSITDALVRVKFADGSVLSRILKPDHPSFRIEKAETGVASSAEYFRLGVEHILYGIDHMLFLLGLLLIVKDRWLLLKTITAFTVAHTLTLGLAVLGAARVPTIPVEATIALSILFLAAEIVHHLNGHDGITYRAPWVVAFCFGLLHGLGFAATLTRIGIPRPEVPLALLLFNLGVEAGQLGFVVVFVSFVSSIGTLELRWPKWAMRIPAYAIGSLAAFWFVQRCAQM